LDIEISRNFIESLSRGLSILSLLSETKTPLTLTELSHQLGLSKSTIQRLVFTLQHIGYIERDGGNKKYRLGPKSLSIGFAAMRNLDLKRIAYPYLEEISKETGETVNLAVLDGEEIVYVERIKTQHILNVDIQIGSRLPVYCTSMGKAMLVFLPESQVEKILDAKDLVPLTSRTTINKEAIKRKLKKVRVRGFATNNEEVHIGVRSVAAPIRNFNGEVIAAVNIAVPSIRVSLKKLETVIAPKVVETANKISFALGYKGKA
jgi:PcaR/PcaU/PobR family beta-ketoadipate pathway transcriptional regulator